MTPTPLLTRRALVARLAAVPLAAAPLAATPLWAMAQPSLLLPTPPGMRGPFYPVAFPADTDADLVQVRGHAARALGMVAHVAGRVLGTDGLPVAGAAVEVWQCDARGRYHHPGDRGAAPDQAFQGYGRVLTGADGQYAFRTIRPVAYPGRTPHIHFAVQAPGRAGLVTQMYVAGEPLNAADGLYRMLRDERSRGAVTVALAPANGVEPGALAGVFDIVLG